MAGWLWLVLIALYILATNIIYTEKWLFVYLRANKAAMLLKIDHSYKCPYNKKKKKKALLTFSLKNFSNLPFNIRPAHSLNPKTLTLNPKYTPFFF